MHHHLKCWSVIKDETISAIFLRTKTPSCILPLYLSYFHKFLKGNPVFRRARRKTKRVSERERESRVRSFIYCVYLMMDKWNYKNNIL